MKTSFEKSADRLTNKVLSLLVYFGKVFVYF